MMDTYPFTEAIATSIQEAMHFMCLRVEEKINSLTSEVEALKASLQSERQDAEELRKAFSEAEARNIDLATKLEMVSIRVDQLCDSENQAILVKCISQNLGYNGGKPVVACVIYKCLLHWRSFELEKTNIFSRIVQTIASAIEDADNKELITDTNKVLAYWLSNSAMLVCLLQRTFRSSTVPSSSGVMRGVRVSSLDGQIQVVPKQPAMLFKKQLTDFVEKIYGMIRDKLKEEIRRPLDFCKPPPSTLLYRKDWIRDWQRIVGSLRSYLNLMKVNNVPPFLVSKVFTQIFSFINIQLFNNILQRHVCCTPDYGDYANVGLAELAKWCVEATDEYAGSALDELRHIREAVDFLVVDGKWKMTSEEITRKFCSVLSMQQLYAISTMCWDSSRPSIPYHVMEKLRVMVDPNRAVSSLFLLDDTSSIPFTVDDITNSMQQLDVKDIAPSQLIYENPSFSFLLS